MSLIMKVLSYANIAALLAAVHSYCRLVPPYAFFSWCRHHTQAPCLSLWADSSFEPSQAPAPQGMPCFCLWAAGDRGHSH